MADEAVAEAVVAEKLVVMLVSSGENDSSQWFEYRPSYFGEIIRVEWDKNAMGAAALPEDVANYLLGNGYARAMTDTEAKAYDGSVEADSRPPDPESVDEGPEPPKHKRKGG
jgi:hypothetical protein